MEMELNKREKLVVIKHRFMLTEYDLAKLLGCSQATISNIINNVYNTRLNDDIEYFINASEENWHDVLYWHKALSLYSGNPVQDIAGE